MTGRGLWAMWRVDAAAAAIVLAATGAVYGLVVAPTLRARAAERAQRELLGPTLAHLGEMNERVRALEQRLAIVREDLRASPLLLEPPAQVNRRLRLLLDLASQSGLELDRTEPGGASREGGASTLAIRMSGRGSFSSCKDFLSRIGEYPDMKATGFRMSGNLEAPDAPITFVFDLAWYTASDGAEGARQAGAPLP